MNKLLIVLLATCLIVSAHAFVKRDAPAETTPSPLDTLKKQGEEIFKAAQDAIGENFEKAKKTAEQLFQDLQKQLATQKKEGSSS